MSNLSPFRKSLLTASIAAWTLALAPAGHAQGMADQAAAGAQKTDKAADLKREETELRDAARANPEDAGAHLKLIRHYLKVGNYPAAEAEARAIQPVGNARDETEALLARALYFEGKTDELIDQIKPADRQPDDESEVRLRLGLAHFDLRELDEAEPLLRDAVRLDPDSWRPHLGLASFLMATSQLPEARQQIEAAHAIAPDEIAVTRFTGELRRAEGDANGAIAEFSKVIEANPHSVATLMERAEALISENKLSEAQRDMDTASKIGESARVTFLTALILARQGKMAEADAKLTHLIGHLGQGPLGYYLAGTVKFWLGQYELADANLAKAVGRQHDASGALRLRAAIALHRKDPARAIELLRPVVEADTADHENAMALARAYVATGHPEQALELYQQVANARPENVTAQTTAANRHFEDDRDALDMAEVDKISGSQQDADTAAPLADLRHGEVEKASSIAESLAKNSPDDPNIQNLLGSVRLAQKRLPEAEAIFRDVVREKPDFTPAAFNLAEVLVAEKRPDEAKALLQQLVQRNP